MKKKKKKRSRLAIPKEKRFRRFWLRRFLLCLAVAAVITLIRMQKQYKEDRRSYESDVYTNWTERAEKLSEERKVMDSSGKRVGSGITNADYYLQQYDEQTFTNMLVNLSTFSGSFYNPSPYWDRAVIFVHPQEFKYYISRNQVDFQVYTHIEDEQYSRKTHSDRYSADTAMSNRIISAYWNKFEKNNFWYYVFWNIEEHAIRIPRPYFLYPSRLWQLCTGQGGRETMMPVRIFLDGDQVCNAEIGWHYWRNASGLKYLHTFGSEPTDSSREIRLTEDYYNYIYLGIPYPETDNTEEELGQEILYDDLYIYGSPTDSDSYKTARFTAKKYKEQTRSRREKIADLRRVINDTSGKLRKKYYKDELSRHSGYLPEAHYTSEEIEALIKYYQIPSPEEELESMSDQIKELMLKFAKSEESLFALDKNREYHAPFHAVGSVPVEINDETWYIIYFEHWDYLPSKVTEYIAIVFVRFVDVVFLSLIWAVISYLIFRSRFKMDEYRRSLTATLAHDLKSPLMAISSYAENLANHVYPEKNEHYYESIMDTTKYMDSIIVNVLELSRLEKSVRVKREKIDMTALTNELLSQMQERIAERNLHVEVTGSSIMKADRQMMTLAVRNLLDNAIKYTPKGGQVTISGQKKLFVIINDMEEESIDDAQQFCDAFVMGDAARSNRKGTGLGLSVVQQIARLNFLKMTVDGKAHSFRVLLCNDLRASIIQRFIP